jgi:5-methyltetrahydrofolate--homocysteine methyltransferase
MGAFACTAGQEIEEYASSFKNSGDDYTAILIQALGDRFAEGLSEYCHKKVRDNWRFGREESFQFGDRLGVGPGLVNEHVDWMINERYRSIRPAAGYPSAPDHTEKQGIWNILDVEKKAGISLTTSYAMNPPSSVSGLYFAHPDARYFGIGRISRDQIEDYASRKGISIEECERWLQSDLAYEPEEYATTAS